MLNDVFVAGLPGLVPVYQWWSVVTFSSVCTSFGLPLPCLLSVLSVSCFFFSKLHALLFHCISANYVSSLHEPYSLYWCRFLINALPSSLKACYVTGTLSLFTKLFYMKIVYKHRKCI